MKLAEYGRSKIILPHGDEPLNTVDDLDCDESLSDFLYTDHRVRQISVSRSVLTRGQIRKIEAERAEFANVKLNSQQIEHCLLISSEWDQCSLSRVIFRDCKILGARFNENKWANVVFDRCKIEYSTFETIEATAPVVFVNTQFKQVTFSGCSLPRGHMSGCELKCVEFIGGCYDEFDLRDNDLSTIRGAANLDGVFISPAQRQQLAEALVSELNLLYLEDSGQ